MVDINIDKFILISQVYIAESEKEDLLKGVVDVLDYAGGVNKIYDVHFEKNKNGLSLNYEELDGFFNIFRDQSLRIDFDRKIIDNNAPDLVEGFFHVPSMIIRK